jgi:hypothetical protein
VSEARRPMPQSGPPAGWYPHPAGGMGYYDGQRWIEHRPTIQQRTVSHPAVGWCLVVAGGLVAIGAFLPWATAFGGALSRNGLDGGSDGIITLILGIALAAIGVVIGVRQGLIWAPIVAAVVAAAAATVFIVDSNDVSGRSQFVSVGSGLWLTGIAAIGGFVAALVGLAVRD